MRDIILGFQDGLVNVLGVILAVAVATSDTKFVIIAGLAAAFAESLSMAAVGYTSFKAEKDHYYLMVKKEKEKIEHNHNLATTEIRNIYKRKGFTNSLLEKIVEKVISNKKIWLRTLLREEHEISGKDKENPSRIALVIGISAIIGSFVPLVPFLLMPVKSAIIGSIVLAVIVLFLLGAYKAKVTIGSWLHSGIELSAIGIGTAIISYIIGYALSLL